MNMAEAQGLSSSDDAGKPGANDSVMPNTSILTSRGAKYWAKDHRTLVASSASGMLGSLLTFPLDTIKTRMQSNHYTSVTACVKDTYARDGVRAFWRAVWVPTLTITASRTTSFTIYQKAKYSFSAAIGRATGTAEPLVIVNKPGSTPTPATIVCFAAAGCTAGSLTGLFSCPFELMKVLAQNSDRSRTSMDDPQNVRKTYAGKGSLRTAANIVTQRGWLGLYSGFRLQLVRDSIGSAIYFATYESTKQLLVKFQRSDSPTSPLSVAIAGGFCGTTAWMITYPIDTAKTQYQRNCMAKRMGEHVEIPKIDYFHLAQYRGLGVSIARTCLTNAIFFSCFEFFKKKINSFPRPDQYQID